MNRTKVANTLSLITLALVLLSVSMNCRNRARLRELSTGTDSLVQQLADTRLELELADATLIKAQEVIRMEGQYILNLQRRLRECDSLSSGLEHRAERRPDLVGWPYYSVWIR